MQGNSRGYLYHDDFQSLSYQQGEYVLCEITMQSGTRLSSRQVALQHNNVLTLGKCSCQRQKPMFPYCFAILP